MGITTFTAAAILAFNALMANAQNYQCECDGLTAPVWKDCETIASTLQGTQLNYPAGSDFQPCVFLNPPEGVDPDSLNCVITYCKREDIPEGENISGGDIGINYATVVSTCKASLNSPGGTCGAAPGGNYDRVSVEVKANPNYSSGSGSRRRAVEPEDRVISETLVWAQPPESVEREHARDFPHDLSKRQTPPDGDNDFALYVTSKNVENPNGGRVKVFGPSPSGSSYTVSSSRSETNSVSSSASLSVGFFEIFEASVSIDVGYEETISETEGYSVPVDCPSGQRGIIYWVPLYTSYSGLYLPSRTQVDCSKKVMSGEKAAAAIAEASVKKLPKPTGSPNTTEHRMQDASKRRCGIGFVYENRSKAPMASCMRRPIECGVPDFDDCLQKQMDDPFGWKIVLRRNCLRGRLDIKVYTSRLPESFNIRQTISLTWTC
ncbi:hypothetical protein Q7P35_011672 [Cladosporium inversicolor]